MIKRKNTPAELASHIVELPVEMIKGLKAKIDSCNDNSYTWSVKNPGAFSLKEAKEVIAIWEKARGPIALKGI